MKYILSLYPSPRDTTAAIDVAAAAAAADDDDDDTLHTHWSCLAFAYPIRWYGINNTPLASNALVNILKSNTDRF